jgi:23S rRNA pseudoU1915 N3-methylase RlmH
MKIQLWSVGKAHESYVKEGIEDLLNVYQNITLLSGSFFLLRSRQNTMKAM